jgi:peroxiredoxin
MKSVTHSPRRFRSLPVALAALLLFAPIASPQQEGPTEGSETAQPPAAQAAGDIRLPTPESDTQKRYLGLDVSETFALSDIDAQVLLIEVFSMYCPHCQREAPRVNELFERMTADEAIRDRVKLIGIGVGNSTYEVGVFQKQYEVAFPLFPDPTMAISRQLGAERTPTFIGFVRDGGEEMRQFLFQPGEFGEPEAFLKTVLDTAGVGVEPTG